MRDHLYQRKNKKTGETNGIWYCWFYDFHGRRQRWSTNCVDRRAAELVLRRFEREANDPGRAAEDQAATYSVLEALTHFVNGGHNPGIATATLSMYLQKSAHLKRLMGAMDLAELDVGVVKQYIRKRLDEGAADGTVAKELVTLRQALRAAHERGLMKGDPRAVFPRFRPSSTAKDRWLPPAEVLALLLELLPHRQAWLVVALYTGGRDSEIDGLCWEDIDWRAGTVLLNGTKTDGAEREIPLQPVLAAVLERFRQPTGYVVGEWNNIRGGLHAACDRAGIARCSPNDLRRTFATWLANEGVPMLVVARLLGHTSTKMVERVYAKIQQATMHRELLKLSGRCDTGETSFCVSAPPEPLVSPESLRQLREILTGAVPRVGIEPTTRGFSVRHPATPHKGLEAKIASVPLVRQENPAKKAG